MIIVLMMLGMTLSMSLTACVVPMPSPAPSPVSPDPGIPRTGGGTPEPTTTPPSTPSSAGTPTNMPAIGNCSTPNPNENWDGIARVLYYEGASSFSGSVQEAVFKNTAWALYTIKRDERPNDTYTEIVTDRNTFNAWSYFNTSDWYPGDYENLAYEILTDQAPMPSEFTSDTVHFISPQQFARKVGVGDQRQWFQSDLVSGCEYDPSKSLRDQEYCELPDMRVRSGVKSYTIGSISQERLVDLGMLYQYADTPGNTSHGHVEYQQDYYYHECYWIGILFVYKEQWKQVSNYPLPSGPTFPTNDPQAKGLMCH